MRLRKRYLSSLSSSDEELEEGESSTIWMGWRFGLVMVAFNCVFREVGESIETVRGEFADCEVRAKRFWSAEIWRESLGRRRECWCGKKLVCDGGADDGMGAKEPRGRTLLLGTARSMVVKEVAG